MKRLALTSWYLILSFQLFAGDGSDNKSPQWYEIVAGVIAIPAAIIGIIYSIELIRKTRLESEKN